MPFVFEYAPPGMEEDVFRISIKSGSVDTQNNIYEELKRLYTKDKIWNRFDYDPCAGMLALTVVNYEELSVAAYINIEHLSLEDIWKFVHQYLNPYFHEQMTTKEHSWDTYDYLSFYFGDQKGIEGWKSCDYLYIHIHERNVEGIKKVLEKFYLENHKDLQTSGYIFFDIVRDLHGFLSGERKLREKKDSLNSTPIRKYI